MRTLFDKKFLRGDEVWSFVQTGWPVQLENGKLLRAAEDDGFDVLVTADQNTQYQQNLIGRKLAIVVLGSNIWPIVRGHGETIARAVEGAEIGSYTFIDMPLPPRRK